MYYPIWRTTNYTTTANTITYRIVYGVDFVIFSGKAVKAPGESEIVVNLNKICKDYLNSLIYMYLSGITGSDEITMESSSSADFHLDILSGDTWVTDYSWGFVNDWSYDSSISALTSGTLSEPINGHASSEMLVPYTYFLESGTTSICHDITPALYLDLRLNPSSLTVSYHASSYTATVKSNLPWSGSVRTGAYSEILSISPATGGSGTTEVTITFGDNMIDHAPGAAGIVFDAVDKTGSVSREFTWYQEGVTYKLLYTSSNKKVITPYNTTGWGVNIISNTYSDGQGVILFDGPVTTVPKNAFLERKLNSIIIPDSVVSIESAAFIRCSALGEVTIPDSVTTIGGGAFASCSSLTGITIPNSVTTIGGGAFYMCTSLTGVTIPDSVTSIGNGAFSLCTSLTEVTISQSVTFIDTSTFSYCTSLTGITIPNSVTGIGINSFGNCTSLTGITIPNSVTYIDGNAFIHCTSLTHVAIPNSVTSIRDGAFSECTSLTEITIPQSVTDMEHWSIFSGCTLLGVIKCYATLAPSVVPRTFINIPSNGTLHYPSGSDYSTWLNSEEYYLGYYNWTGVGDL